jgi:type VI secretion system protein VasD
MSALAMLCGAMLTGCGTAPAEDGLLNKTLGLVGLQTADKASTPPAVSPDLLKPAAPTKMPLRIHASDQLNTDGINRPLSLVIKVYKLKTHEDFMRAPYDAFAQAPYKGDDVVSSRELVLLPGQRYEVEEALPKDAPYVGIVAMFKSPEATRWRFVFDVAGSAKEGVTVGAHQCALSVSQGETVGSAAETRRLAGTVCR